MGTGEAWPASYPKSLAAWALTHTHIFLQGTREELVLAPACDQYVIVAGAKQPVSHLAVTKTSINL